MPNTLQAHNMHKTSQAYFRTTFDLSGESIMISYPGRSTDTLVVMIV